MTDRQRLRVLLVEDMPVNMELERLVFERGDFDVTTVGTGREALAALETEEFDVVALDIKLPDMDGLAIARQLKANPKTRHVPVVAITALAMKGDRERAMASGCDAYITKPIDTRTLAETISRGVQEHREDDGKPG